MFSKPFLPFYEKEAKERQKEHGGTAPGKKSLKAKMPEVLQARDFAAEEMDEVSGRSDAFAAKGWHKNTPT